MAGRTVTIFSTTSADGEALAEGARAIASECGYHVRVSPSPTPMEVAPVLEPISQNGKSS
jgi:hypothetical protein